MKKFFEAAASVIILAGLHIFILWGIFLAPAALRF